MPRGDRLLEHVLRRVGFGASAADLARYSGQSVGRSSRRCSTTSRSPKSVDDQIGKAGLHRRHHARAVLAQHRHQRCAPARAVPHGARPRPLQEKMALFWHNHFATAYSKVAGTFGSVHATKMMAGRPDQVAGRAARAVPVVPRLCDRQLPRAAGRSGARSGHAGLARRAAQYAHRGRRRTSRREIMELFTIGIGDLHRSRRLRRGARVHRLGSPAGGRSGDAGDVVLRVHLQRRPARRRRPRSSPLRSIRTAAGPFRRGPRARACRTASI